MVLRYLSTHSIVLLYTSGVCTARLRSGVCMAGKDMCTCAMIIMVAIGDQTRRIQRIRCSNDDVVMDTKRCGLGNTKALFSYLCTEYGRHVYVLE